MSSLAAGLALALAASVALNASYLFQHSGSSAAVEVSPRRPIATLRSLLRSPVWAFGALLGCAGWALHVGALSRAPLSLVQAFVAGGLALAAPMAVIGLRHRPDRSELHALALMVVALVLLCTGLHAVGRHAAFSGPILAAYLAVLACGAGVLSGAVRGERRAAMLGVAGGLLYGAADLGIKALTNAHGIGGVARSAWLPVAALTTAGAFFAFQRALQLGRPLTVIALMTAATNVASVLGGFIVFGDPLGRTPALAAVHAVAFVLITFAAWGLAPAQARLAAGAVGDPARTGLGRA